MVMELLLSLFINQNKSITHKWPITNIVSLMTNKNSQLLSSDTAIHVQ